MSIDKNVFDPSLLSFADCDYLASYNGEPPIVALKNLPVNANQVTVSQWINRFYELAEQEKVTGEKWIGLKSIQDSIRVYLDQRAKWQSDHEKYGAPKFPSLYSFDSRGNGHLSAPGSDSGRVHSYFDETGKRLPFAISLTGVGETQAWKPEWARKAVEKAEIPQIKEIPEEHCFKCGVVGCGHTEVYKPDSRASRSMARVRLSKHLRKAQFEQEAHLELYTLEFGTVDK